jgi:hypothetical protein
MKELFNMHYTTADKKEEVPEWCPRSQISFLKREPVKWKRFIVGRLPERVCVEMALWYRQSRFLSPEEATQTNVRASLEELFFFGRDTFVKYQRLYNAILINNGMRPVILTYEECEDNFLKKI